MSDLIAALQDARRLCANIDEFGVDRAELDRVWGRINTVLASADRSPQSGNHKDGCHAKDDSAGRRHRTGDSA